MSDARHSARSLVVWVTLGSFSLAALMGVAALLGPGDFGETQGRVLLTTLVVGVTSIAVLCYLATAGRPSQPVGVAGAIVVLVPLLTSLAMIWADLGSAGEGVVKAFGVGAVLAATLAQASLLLVLAAAGSPAVRRVLVATLVLAAVLAVMVSLLILGWDDPPDSFARLLGVVAILDVLGTVVVAALRKFGAGSALEPTSLVVPPDLARRLEQQAAATGRSPEAVLSEALERYLDRSGVIPPGSSD